MLNAPAQRVRVNALEATWRGETARLLAPAELRLAGGAAVDRLRTVASAVRVLGSYPAKVLHADAGE